LKEAVTDAHPEPVYDVIIGNRDWLQQNSIDVSADVNRLMSERESTGETAILCAVNGINLCHCSYITGIALFTVCYYIFQIKKNSEVVSLIMTNKRHL